MVSLSIKERGLFYNFWSISRYDLNWDFMFLENKSKLCKCRANQIFWRIRLRQPVWSYIPITIIRMISWAGMSVHKIFIFLLQFFLLLLFVIFWRFDQFYKVFSPHNKTEKKENKKNKTKTKTLNPWIDLVNLKVLFLRNSKELDFLCDYSNGVCLPNVLKNMFLMLFP